MLFVIILNKQGTGIFLIKKKKLVPKHFKKKTIIVSMIKNHSSFLLCNAPFIINAHSNKNGT